MKTNLPSFIALSLALIIAGYLVSESLIKARRYERSVQVKGLAEREVAANLGVWPIQITSTGNNLPLLQKELNQQKDHVTEFFLKMGFETTEFKIGATNIQDSHANIYRNNNSNPEYRYVAITDLTVRTTNIERLQKAVSESLDLASMGVIISSKNEWRPIEYMFTALNDVKPSMVEEATKNARIVAEKFAIDSGSKVGKIKSANQGIFSIMDRDQNTPEIKRVRVVSTIQYFLED
jgi:hypothetical protein